MAKRRSKRGRKTKYTPEVVAQLKEAIIEGLWVKDACALADIDHATYYRWLHDFPEFRDTIARAEAEFKRIRLQRIKAAGIRVAKDRNGNPIGVEGDVRADMWLMEKRFPDEYGPRSTVKLSTEDALILKRHGLTAEQAMKLLIAELLTTNSEPLDDES